MAVSRAIDEMNGECFPLILSRIMRFGDITSKLSRKYAFGVRVVFHVKMVKGVSTPIPGGDVQVFTTLYLR